MTKTDLKEKIFNLETELEFLKQTLFKEPDFKIDEENWRNLRLAAKKIRKKLYREYYGKR